MTTLKQKQTTAKTQNKQQQRRKTGNGKNSASIAVSYSGFQG
jgi:hypothetical protein